MADVPKETLDGTVTAIGVGTAVITVRTFNKKKTSCKIVVVAEPDQVFLPERLTIAVGEKATVEASAVDRDGASTEADYTFSADEGTGKVSVNSKTGVVKGVAVGTATIRVTTHNGVSTHLSGEDRVETTCEVTVVEPPSEVRLSAKTVTIGVGQTYDLNPQLLTADHTVIDGAGYTASSSNKKRVSVDKNGVVKGLKTGDRKSVV